MKYFDKHIVPIPPSTMGGKIHPFAAAAAPAERMKGG